MRLKKILIGAFILVIIAPFCQLRAQRSNPIQGTTIQNELFKTTFDFKLRDSYHNQFVTLISQYREITARQPEDKPVDSLPRNKEKFRMKKSPLLAVLLSAVLPGAGQFYNQSYWKIPIIAGLIGYFGYEYIINNNKFKDYRDQYDATITPTNQFGDENLKTLREFYRNQRDDFVWYFIIVYVVNLVDAYVDAHLFDFDVREEKLTRFGNTELKLKVNFKF